MISRSDEFISNNTNSNEDHDAELNSKVEHLKEDPLEIGNRLTYPQPSCKLRKQDIKEFILKFNTEVHESLILNEEIILDLEQIADTIDNKMISSKELLSRINGFYSQKIKDEKLDYTYQLFSYLFEKIFETKSELSEKFHARAINLDSYSDLIKDFHDLVNPINNQLPYLKEDFERVAQLETIERNVSATGQTYIKYIRQIQRCFFISDFKRIFSMVTVFCFSEDRIYDFPSRNNEIRLFLEDLCIKNEAYLRSIFQLYANEDDIANVNDFISILRKMFQEGDLKLELYLSNSDTEDIFMKINSFKILLKAIDKYFFEFIGLSRDVYKNSKYVNCDFEVFWGIIYFLIDSGDLCINQNVLSNNSIDKLKENLEYTLNEYESKLELCTNAVERKVLQNTISGLRQQLKVINSTPDEEKLMIEKEASQEKCLKDIFDYYCKLQKQPKRDDTFAAYNEEMERLYVGEWVKFCKDFKLINKDYDTKVKELLTKETIKNV